MGGTLFLIVCLTSSYIYGLVECSCPSYGNKKLSPSARPSEANYLVQPYPVEFTDQPNDLVFFNGSTISLYCETNCVQLVSLKNTSCVVGFLHDGVHLDYEFYNIPYDHTLSPSNWIGRRKITIFNANDNVIGKYQCITSTSERHSLFTDIVVGKPVHVQMAVLEPIGGEVQVVNVPEGESVELSCMRGIYPSPDNISWWRNDINCDSLQCLDNIQVSPSSGSLLLSNVTANISGNVFECEIGWKDYDKTYNVTYQIFVNDSETERNNSTFTEDMIMIAPSIVTLNTIVDGITNKGHNYKEDLLLDISQVSNNYKVNVTITCSFTGHPRPQVNWLLNGDDISSCDINVTIVTEGNTSTLHLMMFDPRPYMGSYQCVVVNKAGYVSKTTRILPRGWTNPPAISSSPITTNTDGNIVISLTWGPPEYTGGESVQYYRVTYTDFENNNNSRVLTRFTTDTSLQFGEFKFVRGGLYAEFAISVVDIDWNEMSDSSKITVDSQPSSLQPEISSVDCTEEIATIDWINHYQDDLNTIWGYCVHHYCNTADDVIINETCVPELRSGYFGSRQQLSIPDLPLKGNCSFRVSVLLDGTDYKWNNNNKTCSRKLAVPVIVVDVKDQTQVEGYSVNFTCQATGEPVPTISWYFNDVPVNMSTDDKHNISTMSVNETSINSRLIVKSVKSSDVGTYTCKATNILSTDNSSGVLSVNVTSVAGEKQPASDVTIWIGIFFSILLISLVLFLLMTSVVLWRRRVKSKEMLKIKANTISKLKGNFACEMDDDFPKDIVSTVETLSPVSNIKSDDMNSFYDYDIEYICKKITHRKISLQCSEFEQTSLFSFRDSEVGNRDMFDSNCTSQCHYYVSKQTSSTTTGDSGIDSSENFSV
ncbi:striated muscle preferentially expressed protein kinase-like isoform X2 [Dysidea avara]|uniref:striated muscle preferentially expressed protein kinase-like isoform X2 n=1 Tax=Dysidea avara TaxID=196820 RepID=UPI0033186A2D